MFGELGKGGEAEGSFREALAIQEKLAAEFPNLPVYREELAETYNNLGILLGGLGELSRPGEAETAHRQALAIQEKLVTEFPSVPRYRGILAVSHGSLGLLLVNQGKRNEAEAAYRQALALREKLVDDFPNMPEFRRDLAGSKGNLGLLLAGQGKLTEAEAIYRQALAIQEKLAADFPNVPQHRLRVGASQGNLGNLQITKQQPEQALPWFSKSIETLESVLGQVNANTNARFYLRNAYLGRATTLDDLKRHADAARDWDRVVKLSPPTEQPRFRLSRASSRVRAGQVEEALKETEDLAKTSDPSILYNAACVFALAAGRPAEAGASLSRDVCGKRAVALLQQAIALGFKDAGQMKKDDDLQVLRGRDDFQKLLGALEGAKPKKP
jgi:tetratricopeptide (TPR) repeat protein